MDSITHLVSGALIGEAIAGKQLKKKAMAWGALAQTLPDVDVISSLWMEPAQNLLAHRGITHSFFFVIVAAPLLAWAATKMIRNSSMTFNRWIVLFGVEMTVHLLLDSLSTYGTGWLEPLSHYRVSFETVFVADPFYTVWLFIPCIILLILRSSHKARAGWVKFGLISSTLYIFYCFINKSNIDQRVKEELSRQQISYSRFMTTPAPLNNWLWYIVAETGDGYYTGYHSVFDKRGSGKYHFFPRKDSMVASFRGDEDLECLLQFSQGYYTIENVNDTLVFNDLRFGQVGGWEKPDAPFVFHYYLKNPARNVLVVQRGRFANAGKGAFHSLVKRIKGN